MKKLLIITNHSYMLWRFRKELVLRLMEEYSVVIATPFVGHEDDFKALGVKCICTDFDRRSINPIKDARLLRTYKRLIKEEKPDYVITYSIKPNIYGAMAARAAGVPFSVNVQGLGTAFQKKGVRRIVTLLYKRALKGVKTVFFENEENARLFRELRIVGKEKQTVLKGAGVNLSEYPVCPYPENDKVRFLYLGRIMREKGIDELFAAAEALRERLGNGFVLDLVGFFEDEYKERVEELCQKGIAEFHGFKTDPRPYYAAADVVVLASWHEGMSNVLLEAAACGRPVIICDIPGCREAVDDGVSGWLCQKQDTESLLEAMSLAARTSGEERARMGEAARRKIEREFSRTDVVESTVKALFD